MDGKYFINYKPAIWWVFLFHFVLNSLYSYRKQNINPKNRKEVIMAHKKKLSSRGKRKIRRKAEVAQKRRTKNKGASNVKRKY